jgi:hypothetical protein
VVGGCDHALKLAEAEVEAVVGMACFAPVVWMKPMAHVCAETALAWAGSAFVQTNRTCCIALFLG